MTHHSSALAIVASVPLVLIAAARPAPQGPPPTARQNPPAHTATLKGHMDEHFAHVRDIQDAVVRGDLEGAKASAKWIADHQEAAGLPAGAEVHLTAMKSSASAVATAPDTRLAAEGAASLVAACGDCHAALKVTGTMPSAVVVTTAPPAGKGAHMAEHQHAVNLLYRGLVGPSEADWKKGAEALKGSPLGAETLPEAKDALAAEKKVHELAAKAAGARDRSARVAAYGEVIGSCASCHGLHGRVWGPGVPKTE
jgi:mono/diheme cytochrome c family protein